jgi:hypothetical protein
MDPSVQKSNKSKYLYDETPLLAPRPLLRARKVALTLREVRERPSRAAIDALLARADVLSEGQRTTRDGRAMYFGSTMLTVDLALQDDLLRGPCDVTTAQNLVALLDKDAATAAAVRALAAAEVARVSGARPRGVATEIGVRAEGTRIAIDVDVEAGF